MSVNFSDIHAMIAARPAMPEDRAADKAQCHSDALSLICRVQRSCSPGFSHPRAAFYASLYQANDKEATQTILQQIAQGNHPSQQFCTRLNADLRVYELDMENPAPSRGLDEQTAAHVLTYGLMAIEEHVDCLIVGSLSQGFARMLDAVERELDASDDVFACVARHGGHDLCALTGAVLAARMALVPVIAAGRTGVVLKKIAEKILGSGDSTVLAMPASGNDDAVAALYAAYRLTGDMLVMECGTASSSCESSCGSGCAA